RLKFLPGPGLPGIAALSDGERPFLQRGVRSGAGRQHGEAVCHVLARRHPVLLPGRGAMQVAEAPRNSAHRFSSSMSVSLSTTWPAASPACPRLSSVISCPDREAGRHEDEAADMPHLLPLRLVKKKAGETGASGLYLSIKPGRWMICAPSR